MKLRSTSYNLTVGQSMTTAFDIFINGDEPAGRSRDGNVTEHSDTNSQQLKTDMQHVTMLQ